MIEWKRTVIEWKRSPDWYHYLVGHPCGTASVFVSQGVWQWQVTVQSENPECWAGLVGSMEAGMIAAEQKLNERLDNSILK